MKPWQDGDIEEARKAFLEWLRAGKPKPTATLRKQAVLYADAVAKRLNTATAPAKPIRARNNGHFAPDPMDEIARRLGVKPAVAKRIHRRLADALMGVILEPSNVDRLWTKMLMVLNPAQPAFPHEPTGDWTPSAVPSFHAKQDDHALIHGIDGIAEALGREPGKVLRSTRKGTLPIAQLDGQWAMLRSLVGHYKKQAKPMMSLDEMGNFSQISSANDVISRPYFFDPATIAPPREAGQL